MLLPRIIRRLKIILTRILISKKYNRPNGVYNTVSEYLGAVKGAQSIEAFPSQLSVLNVTEEFRSRFIRYVDTINEVEIPAAHVVVIPGGRVHTDNNFRVAIISGDNKVIGELSFDEKNPLPSKNNIFRQTYFQDPNKYKGTVCSLLIGEGGIVNYSHWLIDSLSRIAMLKATGWFDKIDWFLVPSYERDYQKDSLQMLGIGADRVIAGDVENHIQADTLIATTSVRYREHIPVWCCNFAKQEYLSQLTSAEKNNACPYVYISRNDSAKRRVLNEPELIETLSKYGFQSFELSGLSFREKISLFAGAKIIIATIGAGQANLIFCEKNTNAIEMMAEDFAQPFFSDLANKAGVHYEYLICKSDGHAKNFKQGEKLNLIADIPAIENKLHRIIHNTAAVQENEV